MPGRTAGAAGAGRVRIVPEMTTFRPRADGGGATRAATRDLRGESTTSRGVAEGNTSNLAIRARSHRSWEGSTDRRRRATRRPLSRRTPSTHRRAGASPDHATASTEDPQGPLDRLVEGRSKSPDAAPTGPRRRRDTPARRGRAVATGARRLPADHRHGDDGGPSRRSLEGRASHDACATTVRPAPLATCAPTVLRRERKRSGESRRARQQPAPSGGGAGCRRTGPAAEPGGWRRRRPFVPDGRAPRWEGAVRSPG